MIEFAVCDDEPYMLDDVAVRISSCTDGGSWIHISGERQGDFYILEFVNTCPSEEEPAVGTGLSNIRAAAEKYGAQ